MMRTKDGFACCYNVQTAVDQTSWFEHTIMDIEAREQDQISCFIRHQDDTVTCPMGYILARVRTCKDGSARYKNRLACRQCPNRCTPGKNFKEVKFGLQTRYAPVLMYGKTQKPLQVYPVPEIPYNAFALLKRRAKKKVVLHIHDDIPLHSQARKIVKGLRLKQANLLKDG